MIRHPGGARQTFRPLRQAASAAALALLLLAGCGDPDPAELLASARDLVAKKETEAARLQLKTVLQAAPDNAEARFLLGRLMVEGGDAAGAEVELRRALELQHPEALVLPQLAISLLGQGKGALLLQQHGNTRLADPEAQAALGTSLAGAEAAAGNLDGAVARIDAVRLAQPGYLPAQLLQVRLKAARGDTAGALAQTQAMTAEQADSAEAWQLQAELLMRGTPSTPADKAAALAAYQKSLAIKGDNVQVHNALVTEAIGRQDFAAATTLWEAMNKVAPKHPQTIFLDAVLAEQRGDLKRARDLTQALLKGAPNNLQVLMLAGQTEMKLGAAGVAEAHFTKAAQLAPNAIGPRRQLAQVMLRSGQADKALAALAPLLAAPNIDVDTLTMAAQAQLMTGDSAAAEATFARAAKISPDDQRVRLALALQGVAKGRGAAALAELRAIAAADKGTTADLALVNVLVRAKDFDNALKAVDNLAAKLPGEALPDHLRGTIALQRQDATAARRFFDAALAKNADYLPALAGLATLDIGDKQLPAAKARFEAALQRNPKNTGALLALAELSARAGDPPAEVIGRLEQAVAVDPAAVPPRLMLLDQLLAGNQVKQALSVAQAGLLAVPDNPELLDRLGRSQLALGEAQQAVLTYTQLAKLAPRSPLPQLRLADAQAAARNPNAVAAAVRRAAELAPDQPLVLQAQFTLALGDGRHEQALALARKVQAQRPDDATGFNMEGEAELHRRNFEAAIPPLRKALAKAQPGEAALRLHGTLVSLRKAAEADALAKEWRAKAPNDMGFVLHLGDVAMAGGRTTEAEALYREVADRQPQNVMALNNLAYTLAMQKKPGAVALAEKAATLAPKSTAVMDTLAFALAADQQLPRAVEVQARAVAASPNEHPFRLQLARLHLQAGDKASARSELSTLAALGNKFNRQAEVAELIKQVDQ